MQLSKKVNSARIEEKVYRSLKERISYSDLKTYDTNRSKFFKTRILGEEVRETESTSLVMGSLVHCLLADMGDFDTKFHITSAKKPGGQIGELCDALFLRTLKSISTNEVGDKIQQDKFETLFSDAFNSVKYNFSGEEVAFKKKDLEWALEKFQVEGQMYYNDCMECIGKSIVSIPQIEQAEKLVQKLKSHPYTADIVNVQSTEEIEVFNELPILFKIGNVDYKSMPDKMHIDHVKKEVRSYDYKTSWMAGTPEYAYLLNKYYLQLGLYNYAITQWLQEHKLEGYTVLPMMFIFIDTTGFHDPLILQPSKDDVERAWRGFTVTGRIYHGIQYLIDEIQHCLSEGVWTTTSELSKNGGIHRMQIRYGSR